MNPRSLPDDTVQMSEAPSCVTPPPPLPEENVCAASPTPLEAQTEAAPASPEPLTAGAWEDINQSFRDTDHMRPEDDPFQGMYADGPILPRRSACDGGGGAGPIPIDLGGAEGAGGAPPVSSPVDIDVVDNHDYVGLLSELTRTWDKANLYNSRRVVTGSEDLSDALCRAERAANGRPIGQLTFDGHGESGWQRVAQGGRLGNGFNAENIPEQQERLRALQFSKNGSINLAGCEVALGPDGYGMLQQLAQTSGVPVEGGVKTQYAWTTERQGPNVTCYPGQPPSMEPFCASSDGRDYSSETPSALPFRYPLSY